MRQMIAGYDIQISFGRPKHICGTLFRGHIGPITVNFKNSWQGRIMLPKHKNLTVHKQLNINTFKDSIFTFYIYDITYWRWIF